MTTEPRRRITPQKILDAFEGPIEKASTSIFYKVGILFVAIAMICLPLIYLSLVAGVGYLTFRHAVGNITIFSEIRSVKAAIAIYILPLAAGITLFIFLIKPLFTRRAVVERPKTLSRKDEPLLYVLVENICMAVGAPVPTEIAVDMSVNASASFRRGLLSFFTRDLTLTIGLPLIAGLSAQELAGVLAHEFGHFSQGTGMRISYIIRVINAWFARLVYDEDAIDDWLRRESQGEDIRVVIIFGILRLLIWLTKRVLWALMMVGHTLSCFLLRQMEYDADRYECELAGSNHFASTSRKLQLLNFCFERSFADLRTAWHDRRLVDDFNELAMNHYSQIPTELLEELDKVMATSKTGLFDTHPADGDRIRHADKVGANGVFHIDGDAGEIFRDFTDLSRNMTLQFYRDNVDPTISESNLVSAGHLLQEQESIGKDYKAAERYFQGVLHPTRPLAFSSDELALIDTIPDDAVATIQRTRQSKLEALYPIRKFFDQHGSKHQAYSMLDVSDLPEEKQLLERFNRDAKERLTTSLSLINDPAVASQLQEPHQTKASLQHLLPTFQTLSGMLGAMTGTANDFNKITLAFAALQNNDEDMGAVNRILTRTEAMQEKIAAIYKEFTQHDYPFDHADGTISIGDYLVPQQIPAFSNDTVPIIVDLAEGMLNKFYYLYFRILGRLASIAEEVELALGMDPFPTPPSDDDDYDEA